MISRGFRMPHRDCGLAPRASRNYANPSVFLNRALASGLRKLQLQTSELGVASPDKLTTLPCRRLRGSESGISQLRNRGRGDFAIAEFGSRGRPALRNCATRISEFRNDRRKYPRAAASTRNQGRNGPHQGGRTAGRNPKSRRFRISESLRPQFRNFEIEPGWRNPARAGSADAETPTESRAQRTPADAKDAAGISKSGDAADPEFRNPPPRHSARLAIANGIRNCEVLRNRVSQFRNPETQAPGCLAPLIS